MKRTILISLAAGVAIVPALIGVAAASTPSHSDDPGSATPTASSTVDDKGRGGHGADDSATTASPTSATPTSASPTAAASSADDRDGRGSDDATASSSADDRQGRGSDDATASSTSSADDRQGRGSDDATASSTDDHQGRGSDDATTSPTRAATATTAATVDDKGHGTESGDDSGGHGGKH